MDDVYFFHFFLVVFITFSLKNIAVACNDLEDEKPLIVTPFIESGQPEKARSLSSNAIDDLKGYSGYFTIDKECSSNLFFWFFPAGENSPNAPLLLWLQGGPGSSSMFGLFQENGPWHFSIKEGLKRRLYPWTKKHNVLYIDQPVGSGFSYSEKRCYPTELTLAAKQVVVAISQFLAMFPELKKNKFFLTGESYSGHTIPAIAVEIDKQNNPETKINLTGIIIGNPFLDYTCINSLKLAYELGVIDEQDLEEGNGYFDSFIKAVNEKNFTAAREQIGLVYSVIDDGSLVSLYNVLYNSELKNDYIEFLNKDTVKKVLHVGSNNFTNFNNDVYKALYTNDEFVTIAPSLEYLLKSDKYIVGFYAGQLDLVCPYTSLTCTLERLQWPGASNYLKALRRPWYVSGRLAGWVKVSGNLFEVAVRNAGHYVPRDQGEAALELITAAAADVPGSVLLTRLDYGAQDKSSSTDSTSSIFQRFKHIY